MNDFLISSFLNKNEIKTIFNIFKGKDIEIRFVGGCVRNIILGREINDIDCAVNIKLNLIIEILKNKNIKFNDFAKKYGSITAFVNDKKIEITSLRKDFKQQGRHTEIIHTSDWKIDARRRDFTMNAVYLKADGSMVDYFGGIEDINKSKIKFINQIENRIKEDYLRIFRYYRFLGLFEKPIIIKGYEDMLKKYSLESFNYLSNDIIRKEILKMFKMPYPLNCFFSDLVKKEKRQWFKITKDHFKKNQYNIGLNKCLNRVPNLLI